MKILTHARLQGVTWVHFRHPWKAKLGMHLLGLFSDVLLCAGAEEPGFPHLTTDLKISNQHEWEYFMQRFDVLDWFLMEPDSVFPCLC